MLSAVVDISLSGRWLRTADGADWPGRGEALIGRSLVLTRVARPSDSWQLLSIALFDFTIVRTPFHVGSVILPHRGQNPEMHDLCLFFDSFFFLCAPRVPL